jgi:DNA-directed RNA polymerase specialized sigma24 family protein
MYEHIKRLQEMPETAAVGRRWTSEEETKLIDLLATDKCLREIALEHRRTIGGIMSRLKLIAVRMIEMEGMTIDKVCDTLRITYKTVESAMAKYRNKHLSTPAASAPAPPVSRMDVLTDIRDILLRIEANL